MSAAKALARTVDLVRADVFPRATEDEVVEALTDARIRLVADERNLSSAAGQTALVTTAIVAAQSGAELVLDVADVGLISDQPPLHGERIVDALIDLASDLVTPAVHDEGQRCDLTIAFGSTPIRATSEAFSRLAPVTDGFELMAAGDVGDAEAWVGDEPFGALFGGVTAGAEAFRAAMRKLAGGDQHPQTAHAARGLHSVRLRIPEPTGRRELGELDVISGGAISHGMLFALHRVPGIDAQIRVFDDDAFDWPNLNRYLLGRGSLRGVNKAELLSANSRRLAIEAIPRRFDQELADRVALAQVVAVGVDDIPSRWRAQRFAPGLVVVGATSHFEVVVSEHPHATPCAGCLYPDGEDDGRPIPTVSFVSALAGALQAYRLLDGPRSHSRQTRAAPVNMAGSQPLVELGVVPRRGCPARCRAL